MKKPENDKNSVGDSSVKSTDLLCVENPNGTLSPKPGVSLSVSHGCLSVGGLPFVVDHPDEPMDRIEDGKLVTRFRGHLENVWSPEDIEGYFA